MTTQILYLPSHPLYLTLHPLYLCHQTQCINYTTPTLCTTSHAFYIWHHIQYAWHHMNSLWHHTPICMSSHPVYLWHHIQCIWYHIYCFPDNTMSISDISPTIFDITATGSVSSHPMYKFYQTQYMYDIIATICMTLYALYMTSYPRFRTSQHFRYDIKSTVSDLTSTVSVSSHPLYRWYHSHHMYDITFTICVTTQNVCISDITHSMFMTYALYMASHTVLWQHNHCVTSQPLCLTSHTLYLCHHT